MAEEISNMHDSNMHDIGAGSLVEVNKIFLNLVYDFEKNHDVGPESNFSHIARGHLNYMCGCPQLLECGKKWEEIRDKHTSYLNSLRSYLVLIMEFKDFRAEEVSSKGAFPDCLKTGDIREYVECCRKKLRG